MPKKHLYKCAILLSMMRHSPIYRKRIRALGVSLLALAVLAGCNQTTPPLPAVPPLAPTPIASQPLELELVPPLDQAMARVTLKTFGLFVSPQHSPVNPERFTGYHTGVDFETFSSEQNTSVNVMAICLGKLLQKSWVKGYGGVAVQACTLEEKPITVVYGHLKLSSISTKVGEELKAGVAWAELGRGASYETDNERKHLHLGLKRGISINLHGYVPKPTDLSQWLDATKYLNRPSNKLPN